MENTIHGIFEKENQAPSSSQTFDNTTAVILYDDDNILGINISDLFTSICNPKKNYISSHELWNILDRMGIRYEDPRLEELKKYIQTIKQEIDSDSTNKKIRKPDFRNLILRSTLLRNTLIGNLSIPDFPSLAQSIQEMYNKTKIIQEGKIADYIPQLARVDPNMYAVSICTVDGQRFSIGDFAEDFCLQSTCKPLLYCIAQEDLGEEKVHHHIGLEPSGLGFNELSLDRNNLPHNPMINAGAIMSCSLIKQELNIADRFDFIINTIQKLSGGKKPNFNNAVYLSERQTADRNFALAHFMREKNAFPPNTDLTQTLEFYFQCCSIEVNAESMAVIGATLANSGICPLTDKRIFKDRTVQNCLSLMLSCGMYDYSGEFAFKIGLPAKSGVSGALLVVIPGLMGIAIWSPPLDKIGNCVRGLEFCNLLAKRYNVHKYDGLGSIDSTRNPKSKRYETKYRDIMALIASASTGDLHEIQRLVAAGVNLNQGDYDYRTALHLAAAEGHIHVVKYLIDRKVNLNPRDRWGGTPISDAKKGKHEEVVELLRVYGAIE
ncbi:MAG: glutaminase A [Microscillaceae bacterium]|nr:glutaminase A [Microscillaceae bacterium]